MRVQIKLIRFFEITPLDFLSPLYAPKDTQLFSNFYTFSH